MRKCPKCVKCKWKLEENDADQQLLESARWELAAIHLIGSRVRLLIHLIGEGGVVIDPGICSSALLTHPLHH